MGAVGTRRPRDFFVKFGTGTGMGRLVAGRGRRRVVTGWPLSVGRYMSSSVAVEEAEDAAVMEEARRGRSGADSEA